LIYLVRHGQTAFNAEHRLQGRLDSPLTALGIAQAGKIGAKLAEFQPDAKDWPIEASPQGRAVATAEIIGATLGASRPIRTDARLREVSMGSWDGLTRDEINAGWPGAYEKSARIAWFRHCPDGETFDAAMARVADWLGSIPDDNPRIVVSHGVTGSLIRGCYAKLSPMEMLTLPTPQDAFFILADGRIESVQAA